MKKVILFILVPAMAHFLLCAEWQVVRNPEKIKIRNYSVEESIVCNLSKRHEIFNPGPLFLIDGSIYMVRIKTVELFRFSLDGTILNRYSKIGRGPGDLLRVWSIAEIDGQLAVLDSANQKIVIMKKNLKFLNEFRLSQPYMGLIADKFNRLILYGCQNSLEGYYFHIFSREGSPIEKFGQLKSSISDRKKRVLFDAVNKAIYIPNRDGIWACFKNRYDLRYYENKKLVLEIKERNYFFPVEESDMYGRKIMRFRGRSIQMAKNGQYLYYFYRIEEKRYCDVFDINTLRLVQRVSLRHPYKAIVHYKKGIFFGITYQNNEDDKDVILYRINWRN